MQRIKIINSQKIQTSKKTMRTRRKQVLVMFILLYVVLCIGFSQKVLKGFGSYDSRQGSIVNYESIGNQYSIFSSMDISSSKK